MPASIATNDDRFLTAIWQNGVLWTGGNDACVPPNDTVTRPCSRLIQVSTAGPTITQDFDIGSTGGGLYYPALAMDGGGNMYVVYNISSATQNVGVRITGELATSPPQTLVSAQTIKAGDATYNMNPCFGTTGASRWGDYAGAAIDPANPTDVWVASEYAAVGTTSAPRSDAGCAWGTFAGRLTFSAPTVTSISPASGDGSTSVSVVGTDFAAGAAVRFGSSAATNVVVSSPNALSATAPVGCGTVDVTVTTPDGTSAVSPADQFTYATSCGGDFTLSASPASQTVTQGAGTTYTVSITPSGGFAGNVTLSAGGLPVGASATFSPNPITTAGNSTMSVTTAGSTPAGSYTLTITGTNGSLSHNASVTLVVQAAPTPDFSLAAGPASQTVTQGAGTSYTVTITSSGGFSGVVSLGVTGLPSGANGTFNPNSVTTSGSSTMSVTTAGTTPAGTYTLTVTGTSGSLSHSTTVTLIVQAASSPDYSLSATSSQTVIQGLGANYTVTITPSGGFTGAVTLSVSGLPNGTSATFTPNPATVNSYSSMMSVSTNRGTQPGTYVLTITGVSGGLSHSTTVTLVVNSRH